MINGWRYASGGESGRMRFASSPPSVGDVTDGERPSTLPPMNTFHPERLPVSRGVRKRYYPPETQIELRLSQAGARS